MTELRFEISEDTKQRMDELANIDWSKVVERHIKEEVFRLLRLRSIVAKSKFTEQDALELGRKVNVGLSKRYRELLSKKK